MTADRPPTTEQRDWFHEYGFTGPEDFEAAIEAVEALGFRFVYGGSDHNPAWPGWPAHADALRARAAAADNLANALDMLWAHYLLVISDEQKAQVREALAAYAAATTQTGLRDV